MKREVLDLFDKIYTKMMYKVSKRLIEQGVNVEDYCEGMVAAARHPQLMADLLGFSSYEMYADWNVLTGDEIYVDMDYLYYQWDELKVPENLYVDFVMKSFDLVAEDDKLCDLLGTDEYVGIIEEANILVLKGLIAAEDVDTSGEDVMLDVIKKYF